MILSPEIWPEGNQDKLERNWSWRVYWKWEHRKATENTSPVFLARKYLFFR